MNFMISCRQPLPVLKKASEIKVDYIDKDRIIDLVDPDNSFTGDINIYITNPKIIDWNFLKKYSQIFNIVLAVADTSMIQVCKQQGFKCYWMYPITSYWELKGLLNLKVDEVLLDAPLYFDLQNVRYICGDNVEIRLVVNKCFNDYMDRQDGIEGTYIRPEDIDIYSQYVQHFEFESNNDLNKELTLLKIYSQQKSWPGNLNLLLENLKVNIDNRGLSLVEFGEKRINCGQICQLNRCHHCRRTFSILNTIGANAEEILERIQKYKDELKNN